MPDHQYNNDILALTSLWITDLNPDQQPATKKSKNHNADIKGQLSVVIRCSRGFSLQMVNSNIEMQVKDKNTTIVEHHIKL
jgi:hypothetical protein